MALSIPSAPDAEHTIIQTEGSCRGRALAKKRGGKERERERREKKKQKTTGLGYPMAAGTSLLSSGCRGRSRAPWLGFLLNSACLSPPTNAAAPPSYLGVEEPAPAHTAALRQTDSTSGAPDWSLLVHVIQGLTSMGRRADEPVCLFFFFPFALDCLPRARTHAHTHARGPPPSPPAPPSRQRERSEGKGRREGRSEDVMTSSESASLFSLK